MAEAKVDSPDTPSAFDTVAEPVTANVVPLKVKFPLSSTAPAVPANTTRPDVKSLIVAEAKVDSPDTPSAFDTVAEPVTANVIPLKLNFHCLLQHQQFLLILRDQMLNH